MNPVRSDAKDLFARRHNVVTSGVGVAVPCTAESAHGATIIDANGQEWIDFGAGIGVMSVGHSAPEVAQAVAEQARKLIHTCFQVSTYEPYIELCEKLAHLFPHGDFTKVMLTNTGSESVENAIKIARQHTKRQAVICYESAFHGRTNLAMGLTSKVGYKRNCGPFAPEIYRIPYPDYFHNGRGWTREAYIRKELNYLEECFKNMVPADEVAAIIIEPIQGEGGFHICPPEYLRGLRKICDEHGIMLICDEVQSGFCRTGKWAAYEHAGITPDLSTWAKAMGGGMPIGCVIGKAEVMDSARPGTLGGTYPGNPVSCAASLATIKIMEERDLCERAQHIGAIIMERFREMKKKSEFVGDVRGVGAMTAMEFILDGDVERPASVITRQMIEGCWNRFLLVLPAGVNRNIIRMLPPLVIEDEQLIKGLDIMEEELMKCKVVNGVQTCA